MARQRSEHELELLGFTLGSHPVDVLWRRVAKKGGRPLLNQPEPKKALARLLQEREPVYAEADHVVISRDGPHMHTVNAILEKLGS